MLSMYKNLYSRARQKFCDLPLTTRHLVLEYIEDIICRQWSPCTVRDHILRLDRFFLQLSKAHCRDLEKCGRKEIRLYLNRLSDAGLAARTINSYLSCVKSFFDYLVEEEHLIKNPVPRHYFLREEKPLPRPMEREDLRKCLSHLPGGKYQCLFLLMLHCGLRVSEACHLQESDVNWLHNRLLIHNGKGKVDRVVYFSSAVKEALTLRQQERTVESSYFFPSPRSAEKSLLPTTVAIWMQGFMEELGFSEKKYTPHTLRHTFATNLLNAGVPLPTLKELMGHKNLNQTLMYAQLSDQSIRESYFQAFAQDSLQQSRIKKERHG